MCHMLPSLSPNLGWATIIISHQNKCNRFQAGLWFYLSLLQSNFQTILTSFNEENYASTRLKIHQWFLIRLQCNSSSSVWHIALAFQSPFRFYNFIWWHLPPHSQGSNQDRVISVHELVHIYVVLASGMLFSSFYMVSSLLLLRYISA